MEPTGLTLRRLQQLAAEGRVAGARKDGGEWVVPAGAFIHYPEPTAKQTTVMGMPINAPTIPVAHYGYRGYPLVITIYNFAGGVGKTSLARDFTTLMAAAGYRILLIDTDLQANLSRWISPSVPQYSQETDPTIYRTYTAEEPTIPTPIELDENLHFVPSSQAMALLEPQLISDQLLLLNLHDAIQKLGPKYDLVILDSPPNPGLITAGNIIAADHVIVPVEGSGKGIQGFAHLMKVFSDFRKKKRRSLRDPSKTVSLTAMVPTKVDTRTKTTRDASIPAIQMIARQTKIPLAPQLTARPGAYDLAIAERTPIPLLRKKHNRNSSVRTADTELRELVGFLAKKLLEHELERVSTNA